MTDARESAAREALARAYEAANLICPAADVRAGNKMDWVREKVALEAIANVLAHLEAEREAVARLREALEQIAADYEDFPRQDHKWLGDDAWRSMAHEQRDIARAAIDTSAAAEVAK